MAWFEPKINWTRDDYFNASDYNRIIGNLSELKNMAEQLFLIPEFSDMGEYKSEYDSIFAREFNAIENNANSGKPARSFRL